MDEILSIKITGDYNGRIVVEGLLSVDGTTPPLFRPKLYCRGLLAQTAPDTAWVWKVEDIITEWLRPFLLENLDPDNDQGD